MWIWCMWVFSLSRTVLRFFSPLVFSSSKYVTRDRNLSRLASRSTSLLMYPNGCMWIFVEWMYENLLTLACTLYSLELQVLPIPTDVQYNTYFLYWIWMLASVCSLMVNQEASAWVRTEGACVSESARQQSSLFTCWQHMTRSSPRSHRQPPTTRKSMERWFWSGPGHESDGTATPASVNAAQPLHQFALSGTSFLEALIHRQLADFCDRGAVL